MAKKQVWKVTFTVHFLWDLFLIRDHGTAHGISEVSTQADVRMKKME